MPITVKTNQKFTDYVQQQIDRRLRAACVGLEYAGNQGVAEMRTAGRYKDHTGNLRSSTGFAVVKDGRLLRRSQFTPSNLGTDKATGQRTGKELASESTDLVDSNEIGLILVAGMEYAGYVEEKGLNVMESAKEVASRSAKARLKACGFKLIEK